MTQEIILKTRNLTKCFVTRLPFGSKKTLAVSCLDLEVKRGEIFGFLGPNGAGKTTTLNMIVGITEPSDGKIELFGEPFKIGNIEALSRIGYVPETTSLPGYFTVVTLLDFYAQLFEIPLTLRSRRIDSLLEMFGLVKEKNTLIENLSMGQIRLVDIMQALINDPELILLDEPTVYLDPLIMERFRKILMHLRESGKTIFMSSHSLPEIERLSDRIGVIDDGKLKKVGPKSEFLSGGSIEEEFLKIVKKEYV